MEKLLEPRTDLRVPPPFCQYADGPCDQTFENTSITRGVFLYPSNPEQIAATIESANTILDATDSTAHWVTWKQFQSTGQVIFCAICKTFRFTDFVVADVTTLNFNLLFEIGFALGLGLPVIPIRDTSFIRDKREFEELGLLDTMGYVDFLNSESLAHSLAARLPVQPIPTPPIIPNNDAPIYVLKGPLDTRSASPTGPRAARPPFPVGCLIRRRPADTAPL